MMPLRLSRVCNQFPFHYVVAQSGHATHPDAALAGCGDLVAYALARQFPLELSKRQQDVERQSPHGGGGVEWRATNQAVDDSGRLSQRQSPPIARK